jgi:hypothetical protein
MVTRQGTNRSDKATQLQEKQMAELALQKAMEEERKKRQAAKEQQKEEHRKEEEARKELKNGEKEKRKAEATANAGNAPTQVVSPNDPKDGEREEPNLNKNLFGIMSGAEGQE